MHRKSQVGIPIVLFIVGLLLYIQLEDISAFYPFIIVVLLNVALYLIQKKAKDMSE